jgi:hypothetical protein
MKYVVVVTTGEDTESSINFYQTTRRYTPEDSSRQG